jgi:hypothetical protein
MADGFPQRARGFGAIFGATLFLPRFLQNPVQEGVSLWVYGGDEGLAFTDGATHTDITGALVYDSTGLHSPWTGGVLNNNSILNNITGQAMYWPATGVALILPDWPVDRVARSVRVFREFIVALDITDAGIRDGDLIRWSDAAPAGGVPQSWAAGAQSLAGSASAAFTPGNIVDGLTLRDQFYIYKAHATYVMSLIGGSLVMAQRPVFSTVGLLARNCVVEWRGSHIMLTDGDVIIHDGVTVTSIADRRIKATIFGAMDPDNFPNSYLMLDKEQAQVWVCVPRVGQLYPDRAAVWSIEDNKWGVRDLGVLPNEWPHGAQGIVRLTQAGDTWDSKITTWDTDPTRWNSTGTTAARESLLFADSSSVLQHIDQVPSFDGTSPTARLQREGLDLGAPGEFKFVTRIFPKIEGPGGSVVNVRVGGQEHAEAVIDWAPFQPFTVGVDEWLDIYAQGRFISVEMESNSDAVWRVPGFDLEVSSQGRF